MTDPVMLGSGRIWWAPTIVAALTLMSLLPFFDALGDYPRLPAGPGLTIDESFNAQQGTYLVVALREYGPALVDRKSVQEVFGKRSPHLPDHPPLGRLWLGLHHELVRRLCPPILQGQRVTTVCARVGSMTAFALTVLIVGVFAGRWWGSEAGALAALCVALSPRMHGHAHLAALESVTNLTWTLCLLSVGHCWLGLRRPTIVSAAGLGILFGLALLTKMQAIFLPAVIAPILLLRWRGLAIVPLVVFGLVGGFVFFVGWPWLWLDPLGQAKEYFSRTTQRAVLPVTYFGTEYADRDAPWHYPFVLLLITPATLPTLFAVGAVGRQFRHWSTVSESDRGRLGLLLLGVVIPAAVFALPGIAVYNGERLFAIVFPIMGIWMGLGLHWSAAFLRARFGASTARGLVGAVLLSAAIELASVHPFGICFYNGLVGWLPGAQRLGMELDYWGASVNQPLLDRGLPIGANARYTLDIRPVFHQFQLDDLRNACPRWRSRDVRLTANGSDGPTQYTLLFGKELRRAMQQDRRRPILAASHRLGVPLAVIQADH